MNIDYRKCLNWSPNNSQMSLLVTKPTKWHVYPAKTQISLGECPVWSESSLCTQYVVKGPMLLHANSEDWSDLVDAQADPSLRWAHSHFIGFVKRQLQLFLNRPPPEVNSASLPPWFIYKVTTLVYKLTHRGYLLRKSELLGDYTIQGVPEWK